MLHGGEIIKALYKTRPQVYIHQIPDVERVICMPLMPNLRFSPLIRFVVVDEGKERDKLIELEHYHKECC